MESADSPQLAFRRAVASCPTAAAEPTPVNGAGSCALGLWLVVADGSRASAAFPDGAVRISPAQVSGLPAGRMQQVPPAFTVRPSSAVMGAAVDETDAADRVLLGVRQGRGGHGSLTIVTRVILSASTDSSPTR